MSAVKATGDNVAGMDRERFTVLMKNSGAFDWAYSRTGLSGKLENRTHITAVLDDLRGVDLSKPVDLRLAMATDQNNFLWKDITLQPQQFGVNIVMDSYSGMPGDPKAALRTVDDPLPVLGSGSGSSGWNGAPPPVPDTPVSTIGATPETGHHVSGRSGRTRTYSGASATSTSSTCSHHLRHHFGPGRSQYGGSLGQGGSDLLLRRCARRTPPEPHASDPSRRHVGAEQAVHFPSVDGTAHHSGGEQR